jgi:hypothetical protein
MATNRIQYLKKVGLDPNESYSLKELSKVSKVPVSILEEVKDRGMAAHDTNLSSVRLKDFSKNPDTKKFPESARLSPQQWGVARVYSFLNKGKTYKTADSDLAKKAKY